MKHLFNIPEDFAALSNDELQAFIDASLETAAQIGTDPAAFVTEDRAEAQLASEMREGVEAIEAAKTELASRATADDAETVEDEPVAETDEPEPETAALDEIAQLATRADELAVAEPEPEPEPEPAAVADAVTAAAPPARRPAPSRSRRSAPTPTQEPTRSLTAAAPNLGFDIGADVDELGIARMMEKRRAQFGNVAPGTEGERLPIARVDWADAYPSDRRLGGDMLQNESLIREALKPAGIQQAFEARKREALVAAGDPVKERALLASGGLCAPVTPYYQLAMISTADRPVRGMLPSFNADRGGIRYARPAGLSAITTGTGIRTAANDFAGGTEATKTCQTVVCPPFQETDVAAIFHCLKFGNLGARTFPERVAQWNSLTLAAQARTAETALLDAITAAATAVSANNATDYGASSDLLAQFLTAADAMRSRHRMAADAVLRLVLPFWAINLLVSDALHTQFERFAVNASMLTAWLREHYLEPSYYLDGPTSGGQVFGAQAAAHLINYNSTVKWFLYPEGSFIFLDGGTLELGLVRDSTLNATNDFEIFGETFENVAFVGVEALAVTSTVCDSGALAAGITPGCPNYV